MRGAPDRVPKVIFETPLEMDLTSGSAEGVQTMVDTVEVVSAGEQTLDSNEENANVTINVVSSHSGVSMPSSGVSSPSKRHSG